ncbi:hypothetical protein BQ8794_70526 [Mesorhizobium prunaredense]|uniref:Uncharacterized protein n=1 Tax=Mesorhizobium prunaredense TaxID=1631249 RepID=A0A1R3VI55_9HYPH|nr:hypothetical protein BQ8794_70526 [Mesorhizobium prunaredense]
MPRWSIRLPRTPPQVRSSRWVREVPRSPTRWADRPMPPTSSRVRASTTLSAQITWNLRATSLGAITDISIGDEFARTAHHGLWQVRSRAYEYLQAQSPSCSDPADGKRDIAENGGTSSFSQPSEFACHSAVCLPALVPQAMTR